MTSLEFIHPDDIRIKFTQAMSNMYRKEVPIYGDLLKLVEQNNDKFLNKHSDLKEKMELDGSLNRLDQERHGAIRLGTVAELRMIRRIFALMGMFPVGYYDLSQAGIPVHATAFRPIDSASLHKNPFRVFTSLLRLDLVEDKLLVKAAKEVLDNRDIFTAGAREHVLQAEKEGGVRPQNLDSFVAEVLETFRWHHHSNVDIDLYQQLHDQHRLIADVVCFKGPHINHLTPSTLDIDLIQQLMIESDMPAKAVIEGPPTRKCPILLRQTSFKALEETVSFAGKDGASSTGRHSARFGEIEQRGVALTPKGHALYEKLLQKVLGQIIPSPDGKNTQDYYRVLNSVFEEFPDSWEEIRQQGLGYFTRTQTGDFEPIIYEDFLPVSAAGIFQSNLGGSSTPDFSVESKQDDFEKALACTVYDPFKMYAEIEQKSLNGLRMVFIRS